MTGPLRAELLKLHSTRTTLGLFYAMLGLVLLAVVLHGFSIRTGTIESSSDQLSLVFGWGERMAAVFAGILGAMAVTGELRHGTIRPTLLVTPRRTRVIVAKVLTSVLAGAGLGLSAAALAIGVGSAALELRGVDNQLAAGDYAQLMVGGIAAAALWAAIGVGLGAILRNQVPTLIGICTWLLFVEQLFLGDLIGAAGDVGRFLPGAAAAAISGQDPDQLLGPAAGLALLGLYALVTSVAGALATNRRDVA